MKKVALIVLAVLAVIGAVGYFGLQSLKSSFDQVKLQYDNEVISKLKREIDFSTYENGVEQLKGEKLELLNEVVLNEEFSVIQKNIVDGKFSCEELLYFYVKRIKEYDTKYKSVIQLNPKAIELAKEMDEKLKNGENLGELFGAFVLIKDNISEKNMNTASGAYALKDLRTKRDSFIVERIKNEDAIILGKANLSEWSNFMSMPSSSGFSVLGGQTQNPYGKFDVGGSSSGSSVAAAAGFATVTIGSETAGSLIFPAGQNSVIALKPTMGTLSRDLIVPISEAQDTAGIIGKHVADVMLFNSVAVGNDENDPMGKNADALSKEMLHNELNADYLKGKRLGMLKDDTERAKKMRAELEKLGAEVVDIEISDSPEIDMMSILNYGMVNDVKAFLNNKDVVTEMKSLNDVIEFNKEDSENRKPYGDTLHTDALKNAVSKEKYEQILANNRKVSSKIIDSVLAEKGLDAIVSFSNELSGIYAPAMYPAVTVPAGYRETGEPYGVTFVASLNEDIKLMNIAYAYEQGTKHRLNPKMK